MNKKIVIFGSLSAIFAVLTIVFAFLYFTNLDSDNEVAQRDSVGDLVSNLEVVDEKDHLYMDEYFESLPEEDLSQDEIDGLLLMREEEKLAHDVYTTLYEMWGQRIFNNISKSEQTHTDMVAELLDKYDIEDPVQSENIGVFENEELASLYDDLVSQGEKSLVDALVVGATVEDLDLYDLGVLMGKADNEDILAVYQNLAKGSRNHLRSFTRMLNRNGEVYDAQYISELEYDGIIGSPSENGITYDSTGSEL